LKICKIVLDIYKEESIVVTEIREKERRKQLLIKEKMMARAIWHLRQSRTWNDAACSVERKQTYEVSSHTESPQGFKESILMGGACKRCIPIYNRRKAEWDKKHASKLQAQVEGY
jgi:hypothetical protein